MVCGHIDDDCRACGRFLHHRACFIRRSASAAARLTMRCLRLASPTSRPFRLLRWPAISWSWRSEAGAFFGVATSSGAASGRLSCCRCPLRFSAAIFPCRRGCSSDCLRLPLAISGLLMLWQPLWRREPKPAIGPLEPAGRSGQRRCARPSRGHHRDRRRNLPVAAAASAALGELKGDRRHMRRIHPGQFDQRLYRPAAEKRS